MQNKIKLTPLGVTALSLLAGYTTAVTEVLASPILIHQSPLFLTTAEKANVLVILDNSNSMDEAANGSAVGSANPNSKSEIARTAVNNMVSTYTDKINMGLMAYQQLPPGSPTDDSNLFIIPRELHASYYDASYNPSNYDPSFTGLRNSTTKRFRIPNPTSPGDFIHYNVTLPFYSDTIQNNSFCYAPDGNAFDDGEVFIDGSDGGGDGPWDFNRCFENKTGSSDTLPVPPGPTPPPNNGFSNWSTFPFITSTINTSEISSGYSNIIKWHPTLNIFGIYFFPTDSDIAQGIVNFGKQQASFYASPTWISNQSPGRGYLHIPISDLDTTQAGKLNTKLGTSQFTNNQPTNDSFPLQNAGLTPLEGTLMTARNYFDGTALLANEGGPAPALPESCGKDFIALLTDGLPSTDMFGTVISNTATALSDVASVAASLNTNGVETYMIGFALPTGTNPTSLNAIAAAGGTGTAFLADDPASLQAAFDSIFLDILAKTGASSSAATNSTSLSINSFIYQARFNSGDWNGQLLAKSISLSGVINPVPAWDAAVQLNAKLPNDRVILTYGRDTNDGIPFRWSNINGLTDSIAKDALNIDPISSSPDTLGADRVDYIRGGTGGSSAGVFRNNRVGKLGDIINSTPQYVGAPDAGYNDTEMPNYTAFRTSQLARTPILYSGANDGMLHGFDTSNGEEVLAYIPRTLYPTLNKLTAPGYGTGTFAHHFFVDGAPMVADADASGWKTILAGGLNAGGQGIYALDITNPTAFAESAAADIVLWEFSDEDDADLGYTFIQPTINTFTHQSAQIAKMANGKWAVIIGNGYNNTEADGHASTTGHAYLYILFIEEGIDGSWSTADYVKIDTGKGSVGLPNGLATPAPIDADGDGDIDRIYAGDLLGNLWAFDVSDANPSNWDIALPGHQALFTAKDSSSNPQIITTVPLVTKHPDGGYMVGFGTGKYIETSDLSDVSDQTVYGIRDDALDIGASQVSSRSDLVEQTILTTVTVGSNSLRVTSKETVDYTTKKGWFMDLPESGERISVNPIMREGRFVFVSRTPSSTACSAGGSSWIMELDYLTGGRLDISPFDANGDGHINTGDFQTITVTIAGTPTDITIPSTGIRDNNAGMLATPTVIETDNPNEEFKVLSDSNGTVKTLLESVGSGPSGRLSWQEIR